MLRYLLNFFSTIENKYKEVLSAINIDSFTTLLTLFKERKHTAVLFLGPSFFEKNSIKKIKNNQGVLNDYEHIIVVIPQITITELEKSIKHGGFPTKGTAKQVFKEVLSLAHKGKIKLGLLGNYLTYVANNKMIFIFPDEQIDYSLNMLYRSTLEHIPNKPEKKLFIFALGFSKYYDTFISDFNSTIYMSCERTFRVTHLNPESLNEEEITYDNFEKTIISKL